MTEFIKICPKCQHLNPEYENICSQCQQFIGMEAAVPKPVAAKIEQSSEALVNQTSPVPASVQKQNPTPSEPQQQAKAQAEKQAMYLKITINDQLLTIYSGNIVGQAHASSTAQVQIAADVAGIEYVHRQHCCFTYQNEQWFISAIDQSQFQQSFTNPTQYNQQLLNPGQQQLLANGDQIQMSGVQFIVRII